MESSQKQPESEATKFSKTVGVSGATVQPQLSQASQEKWRRVGAQISEVLAQLPDKPTLNLVGIGYSTWFVNRYLLKASTRQELFQLIQNFLNK